MADDTENKGEEGPTAGDRVDAALDAAGDKLDSAKAALGGVLDGFGKWGRKARQSIADGIAPKDGDDKEGGE